LPAHALCAKLSTLARAAAARAGSNGTCGIDKWQAKKVTLVDQRTGRDDARAQAVPTGSEWFEAPHSNGPAWSGSALVVLPTYNEAENVALLVSQLRNLPGDVHVLVVDDASPDGTGRIADQLAETDAGVSVLHRTQKLGLGTAYLAGFAHGLEKGYQYLCTMDADFSHPPEALPALLDRAAAGAGLVIGSRYVPGGQVVGSTLPRRLISYSANWLAHAILGIRARDCTAGFRCYRRTVLQSIDLTAIFSSGYSFLIEMAYYCQRAGVPIAEVPITFVNRTAGTSKINRAEIFKALYTVVRLRVRPPVKRGGC
jgi:dolichol-phosphate mannosyltransferase